MYDQVGDIVSEVKSFSKVNWKLFRRFREKRGVSIREAAEWLNYSIGHLSYLERGTYKAATWIPTEILFRALNNIMQREIK